MRRQARQNRHEYDFPPTPKRLLERANTAHYADWIAAAPFRS